MLENLYQNPPKSTKFINRKYEISSSKTIISGSIKSGKTSLICEKLNEFKEKLYINLDDLRVKRDGIFDDLNKFLDEKNIEILAIENLKSDEIKFIKTIEQKCKNIIISTTQKDLEISGFTQLNLNYLDYEEFILFYKKNLEPSILFSQFLTLGNSPKSAFLEQFENIEYLQNSIKQTLTQTNQKILIEYAKSTTITPFEIYKNLKQEIKISKDSIYKGINELLEAKILISLSKFNEPSRKIFFSNFILRNILNDKKDFTQIFKNAVFCELLKLKDEIFYTKELDFFLPKRKLAIICVPFSANEIVFLKFQKIHHILKELKVIKLQVISVSNSMQNSKEGIKCEIVPFYRWALGLD